MKNLRSPKELRANPLKRRHLMMAVGLGIIAALTSASGFYKSSSAPVHQIASQNSKTETRQLVKVNVTRPSMLPLPVLQLPGSETVATFEVVGGLCTAVPKATFALGETVCAKVSNAPLRVGAPVRRVNWSNTNGVVRQSDDITSDPQEFLFTIAATETSVIDGETIDNRGVWGVSINSTADSTTREIVFFNVKNPLNPAADLQVYNTSTASGPVAPGSGTAFVLSLRNSGPDAAGNVHATQVTPPNLTFVSTTQAVGEPQFSCTYSGGTTDCTIASFASGEQASITINYTINNAAPGGVVNTRGDVDSDTEDPRTASNSSEGRVEIQGSGASTCALVCPLNRTVGANATQGGNPGAIVNFASDIESSGDCGTVTSLPVSGSFFPVGTTPVSSSASGGGSCTFTITVTESAAPTIACAADQTASASGSTNEASVTVDPPTATGDNVVVTGVRNDNRALNDPYPVGTTTITWSARECTNPPNCDDPNSRFATCTQRIIVTDAGAPTISCPANITSTAPDCNGKSLTAGEIGTPTGTGSNIVTTSRRSDDRHLTDEPYPVGTTTITWTVTDDTGRQASCTQTVTISNAGDTTDPTITAPPNVTVTTDACGQIVGETQLGTPDASDDCGTPNVARTGVPTGNFFPTGTTTITYTATDGAGNTATATQTVTVTESINPTITAPADLTVHTGAGATACDVFVGDATLGAASANDNCPGVTVAHTGVPAGNNFPLGPTTITYTATDKSGNTAIDTQVITVVDNTAPTIAAPADVTLETGPGAASCGVTVSNLDTTLGTATTSDNCSGTITVARGGVPAGNVFPLGETIVSYTATDANGNPSATVTQKVTVVDNTDPVVSCPANVTVYLPPNSTATSTAVSYPAATATDNCPGPVNIGYSHASGSVFPVGPTTVTVTATDANGNDATCTFTVTVLYNFTGFFNPVNNPPTFNNVNAGRAIPVKFSLSGNKGLNIFAAGYPVSQQIACDSSAPLSDVEGTETSGGSTLTYSPDQYHYNWKTESSWAGTCRILIVKLNDGTDHTALFKFK